MEQDLFNLLVALAGCLGGWVLKAVWDSVKDLQKEDKALADKVGKIEVLVAGQYVTRQDFKDDINLIFQKLDEIKRSVDGKADK